MFPQHTLIISILARLWTGPATLTAFDALLFFLCVTILILDRGRATFFYFLFIWFGFVVCLLLFFWGFFCSGKFHFYLSVEAHSDLRLLIVHTQTILYIFETRPSHNNNFIIIASFFTGMFFQMWGRPLWRERWSWNTELNISAAFPRGNAVFFY